MKQLLTITVFCLAIAAQLNGQVELFDGLFGKEEPAFHASFTPTGEEGVLKMEFYFTHPNLDELEASFWIKDLGANLMGNEAKRLIQGLEDYGNRQQADIYIKGLKSRHFYTIGIDYRGKSAISRKFASKALEESYRYEYKDDSPEPPTSPRAAITPVQQPKAPAPAPQPCEPPSLFVKVEPAGYCGADNRPAVILQCDGCQGRPWEFSVEVRSEFGQWQPLRADGKRQQALGAAPRTEPLCTLEPGNYFLRVMAWGNNCSSPVSQTIGTPIRIAGDEMAPALDPAPPSPVVQVPDYLPDTCIIESEAVLEGSLITGFIELDPASPCSAYNPFAKVRYVHPGYRDITISQVPLEAGQDAPFKVRLDAQDLSRGIHPLQVVVCIRPKGSGREIPVSSFWIRAESDRGTAAASTTRSLPSDEPNYLDQWQEGQGITPAAEPQIWTAPEKEEAAYPPHISAAPSRCGEIQGLQLIYVPERPEQPLYIAWKNPGCCQEEGCEYTVSAGSSPNSLRTLATGQKAEATVRELIQGAGEGATYYEVVVRTPDGIRTAAYVPGQGPKYGSKAGLAYEQPSGSPYEEALAATQSTEPARGVQLSEGLAARSGGAVMAKPTAVRQPAFSPADFEPCRIFRETHIIANKPIQQGDRVTIEYDYNDPAYRYSLYHLPEGASGWVVAPGTQEFQPAPSFEIEAQAHHSGKYLVLAIKKDKSWGCLSAPVNDPIEIRVLR